MAPRTRTRNSVSVSITPAGRRLRALTSLSTFSLQDDVQMKTKSSFPPIRFLITACTVSLTGTFHFGWSLGTTNNAAVILKNFVNESIVDTYGTVLSIEQFEWVWSFYVSSMFLAAPIGTQFANVLSVKYGRRRTLLGCGSLAIAGLVPAIAAAWANSFELLLLSRIIVGVMIGASCVQFVYMSEISPPEWRGVGSQISAAMIPLAQALAIVFTAPYLLGTSLHWQYMFVIELCVALFQLLLFSTFCPETPAYLLASRPDDDMDDEFMERVADIVHVQHAVDKHTAAVTVGHMRTALTANATVDVLTMFETFKDSRLRPCLIIATWMALGNVLSGISVITAFSTQLLHDYVHFDALEASNFSAIMLFTGFIASAGFASYTVERWGRRPLYIVSTVTLSIVYVVMFVTTLIFDATHSTAMAYIFMIAQFVAYMAFIIGVGPISLYITTELLPAEAKSSAQSATQGWMRFLSGIAVLVFPPLELALGSYIFLFFAVPLAVLSAYVTLKFPETRAKPIDQIVAECNQRTVWRRKRAIGDLVNNEKVIVATSSIASRSTHVEE